MEEVREGWFDLLMKWHDVKLRQRTSILAWSIWLERNTKVFEGTTTPNVVILARVEWLVLEHNTYTKQIYAVNVPRHPSNSNSWSAPLMGVVKMNVDFPW